MITYDNNKDNKINTNCFSANQAALGNKSKDWLTLNQNNLQYVYPWVVLLSYDCKQQTKRVGLMQSELNRHLIEMYLFLSMICLKSLLTGCLTTTTHSYLKTDTECLCSILLSKSQSCSFIFMTCHHSFDGTNTTMYMKTHFPGWVQAFQWNVAGIS